MPKRGIGQASKLAIDLDGPEFYSAATVKQIIEEVGTEPSAGSAQSLQEGLEQLATRWSFDDDIQRRATPKQLADKCEEIDKAFARLFEALGVSHRGRVSDTPSDLKDAFGMAALAEARRQGDDAPVKLQDHLDALVAFRNLVRGVRRAAKKREAAVRAAREEAAREKAAGESASKATRGSGAADRALIDFVLGLAMLWNNHWGTRPGVSMSADGQKVSGPFFRFVKAVITELPMEKMPSDLAIKGRIQEVQRIMTNRG